MLANLKGLDLFSYEFHKIPAGILPKLCRLQKLRINWGSETQRVAVEEGTRLLKNLNSLTAQFCKLQDFNCYIKSLNSHGILSEYCLLLSQEDISNSYQLLSYWRLMDDFNKVVILEGFNICGREEDSIVLPKEVEFLFIKNCNDVRNISNIPTFNTLEILLLEGVDNLSGILLNVSESSPAGQYSHLKVVPIYGYHKLIIILPKLRKLTLLDMSELKSIINVCGRNEVMVCDSLHEVPIFGCPLLRPSPTMFQSPCHRQFAEEITSNGAPFATPFGC
ncbi:hypothetical protein Dsin_028149 [Dipteronia sinensis]|uniref:Uncharacterized protein n=1 Tax=Dipteronia sinensis TaxID=43782 RepID=A0AAE0DTZ5_9ROSI|nr:hypothetical protein Dsin_028149 [Dipteronia sinensis]